MPKKLIGIYEAVYEADVAPALKLPESWAEYVFNPDLLPLMFQIYWKVRDNDQLSHPALACLVQLASLSGRVMLEDEPRMRYLHSYLKAFFNLVSNVTIKSRESVGIANIVKKLIIFFSQDILKLTKHIKDTLLDEFTRLTCHFCEGAALEEAQEEDRNFSDAFDGMLEAWTSILQEFGPATVDNNLSDCAKRVFEKYVQCRLAPPDGCRRPQPDVEKGEETDDSDKELYKDQLQAIGLFGRAIAGSSVPLLFNLLESRTSTLFNSFQEIRNRTLSIGEASGLDTLYEDIHWILLIAGQVLCFDREGNETMMIPSEIIRYSIDCCSRGQCTVEASLQALQLAENNSIMPADFEKCDHIIRLFFDVMKLCYVEDYVISSGMKQFLSPELGSTIMWFLNRFCVNYLTPIESYYTEMSPTILGCLGVDTEGAQLVIRYVLKKIQSNVYYFQSETQLLQETIDCFCHIVSNKHKSIHIVNTTSLRQLVVLCESLEPGTMPQNGFRGMYRGFSLCGACLSAEPERMRSYFVGIMGSLQTRFEAVCTIQGGLASKAEDQRTLVVIVDLLEAFIGLAKGALMPTATLLFEFLAPILNEMHAFMSAFNNYHVIVQLILELFGQVAKYMLCYLSPMDSKRLYESALATVQTYAKCNMNRFTTESFAEDTSFQDLVLVLELLTFIISKDCFDLCVTSNDEEITVTASDVSLFGLSFILPLMSMDLLKYPSLCMQYYRLLVLVNDIYPEKICGLPQDLLQNLLKSIEFGLTEFGSDIVQICLDFLLGMASYVYRHKLVNTPLYAGLRPFLKILIDLTLTHQINSDLMSTASASIYALICCYQEDYRALVESLLQMQSDPMTRERLAAAFNNLVLNVEMNCERVPKLRFRDNFDKFIANVHGFLLIK
ncbi:unnamed protein product [Callosobruchus maculatus]|uniref:Exportin-4 n=1 Tax=Callosobruchus maculatus TaxID=64391 RepID=A0A653DBP8_CALMS|nr:unnamed protein product [Callosobruchus maculatus]